MSEELDKWLQWADSLTGHKHYLPSKMRAEIQSRLASPPVPGDAAETLVREFEAFMDRKYWELRVVLQYGVVDEIKREGAALIRAHFPAAAQPAEAQNVVMYEDDLPADMPQEDYDRWFARSWVPDGVGCRVGPLYPFPGPAPTREAALGELRLYNRADGVRGHYCVGRLRDDGVHEFWNQDGFYSAGEVFIGKDAAEAQLRELAASAPVSFYAAFEHWWHTEDGGDREQCERAWTAGLHHVSLNNAKVTELRAALREYAEKLHRAEHDSWGYGPKFQNCHSAHCVRARRLTEEKK